MFIVLAIALWKLINFRLFYFDDCRSWPREENITNPGCWGKHVHIHDNDYWGICLFHVVWTNFVSPIILMWYKRNIFLFQFSFFTAEYTTEQCAWEIISPKKVQILGHAYIICITVREDRIICCQIFCNLHLKSAFERIFNVMELILVKIKWHIKWKYLIQKFNDICLLYYFNNILFVIFSWNIYIYLFYISKFFSIDFYQNHSLK